MLQSFYAHKSIIINLSHLVLKLEIGEKFQSVTIYGYFPKQALCIQKTEQVQLEMKI